MAELAAKPTLAAFLNLPELTTPEPELFLPSPQTPEPPALVPEATDESLAWSVLEYEKKERRQSWYLLFGNRSGESRE